MCFAKEKVGTSNLKRLPAATESSFVGYTSVRISEVKVGEGKEGSTSNSNLVTFEFADDYKRLQKCYFTMAPNKSLSGSQQALYNFLMAAYTRNAQINAYCWSGTDEIKSATWSIK